MIEIIRRIALAAGLFTGIWLLAYTVPDAVTIREPSFERSFERKARWKPELTIDQYIAEETAGENTARLTGQRWSEFRQRIRALLNEGASDPELKVHLERGPFSNTLYFAPDDPLITEMLLPEKPGQRSLYLEFDGEGPERFLALNFLHERVSSYSPGSVVHPNQPLGWLIIFAGLAAYIVLPWKTSGGDAHRYGRVRGVILPDIIGILLGPFLFAIVMFVFTRDSIMMQALFARGYFLTTLIALLFSIGGIVVWIIAAWFAHYEIKLLPDRLRFSLLTKTDDFPYNEIVGVEPIIVKPPRWLVWAQRIMYLTGQWRTGAYMTAGTRNDPSLVVRTNSGHQRIFSLTGFAHADWLLLSLRDRGVAVSPEAFEFVYGDNPIPAEAAPLPPAKSPVPRQLTALFIMAIIAGLGFWRVGMAEAAFAIKPIPPQATPIDRKAFFAQSAILDEMRTANERLRLATEKVKVAKEDERAAALKEWTEAKKNFDDLKKRYDEAGANPTPPNNATVPPAESD